MSDLLLIDTSVLVALERNILPPEALARAQPGARLAISAITASELLHGLHRAKTRLQRRARERFLLALFSELPVFPFDLAEARVRASVWAALAERGEIIGPHDLIIAATALAHRIPLATLNEREFGKVDGLRIVPLKTPGGLGGKRVSREK